MSKTAVDNTLQAVNDERLTMTGHKEKLEIVVEELQAVPGDSEPTGPAIYLHGAKLMITMLAVFGVLFLVSLDRFVLAPSIPQITDDFHTVNHVGWYGSAYLLTWCGFALQYGKIYSIWNAKIAYIVAILLFEIGSVICATSRTSIAFIIGRAVCGIGSAGIGSGSVGFEPFMFLLLVWCDRELMLRYRLL